MRSQNVYIHQIFYETNTLCCNKSILFLKLTLKKIRKKKDEREESKQTKKSNFRRSQNVQIHENFCIENLTKK